MKPNRGVLRTWTRLTGRIAEAVGRDDLAVRRYGLALSRAPADADALRHIAAVMRRAPARVRLPRPHTERPERFCLFVGYPRSGHSLVGSLLDAHPHAVLAHEFNTLQQYRTGLDADELCLFLQLNSAVFARMGRSWTGYAYEVPGQHQGRAERLVLLGDKKGAATTRQMRKHPDTLPALEADLGVPFVFVHVMRHPLDNIATWAQRQRVSLERATREYFQLVETVADLRAARPEQVHDVYLESLIGDPRAELVRLCAALGLEQGADHLDACANVVFGSPRRSRDRADWPDGMRDSILERAGRHDFLRPYAEGRLG